MKETDGTKNACSVLYAAAWRAARAMGYKKLITYILDSEPYDAKPLWFLGKSFELLSKADLCIFVDGADNKARGCWMEYQACLRYGIDSCAFDTQTGFFVAISGGI